MAAHPEAPRIPGGYAVFRADPSRHRSRMRTPSPSHRDGALDHPPGEVTRAVAALRGGDRQALNALFDRMYPDLRDVARQQVYRCTPGDTVTPTVLVHELYLKLSRAHRVAARDRAHFLALAGRVMRQILVDRARGMQARKRSGGPRFDSVVLDGTPLGSEVPDRGLELMELDRALSQLESLAPRLSNVVELRFFSGLSCEETAEVLGVTARTIRREWRKARAFLLHAMAHDRPG